MNRRERRAGTAANPFDHVASAASLCEAGLSHLRSGRYLDAQLCCRQALAADPNCADALHLMGLLSLQAEQHDLAIEWIARALRQEAKPQYLLTLASLLKHQGRLEEALKALDKAVQLKPDSAELWKGLGNVLVDLDRRDQAILAFQHVLKLNPEDREAAYNVGSLLAQSGRTEEAMAYLDLSDRLQPNHAPTLQMRALAEYDLKRFDDALADIGRAQALEPAQADICNNFGVFLHRLGRDEEALTWFARALSLRPHYPAALQNKAGSLVQVRRFDEAFAAYDALKAIDSGNADAEWASALLHLLLGHFEAGWAGREVRWRIPSLPIARFAFSQAMWLGKEPVGGKTILVHVDEGLGDTIQFARYVPMLAERGARVTLVVADALRPLLSSLPGVAECLAYPVNPPPAFDMYCPMSSLPLAFGTTLDTIPAAASYLPAPPEGRLRAWEERLGAHDRLRVGLVWSGNPQHKNDHNRSLSLRTLRPILDLDAVFVSLQKDPKADDKAALREFSHIVDWTDHLTDFTETAALLSSLDLVITVDTSVAHLSAALGRPTWILLPYTPDYRWLLDRDDSPWYPTVRLFRQSGRRDYAEVVSRVRTELAAATAAFGRE
jgi:tetratricopeptide (TPR) repeat protein